MDQGEAVVMPSADPVPANPANAGRARPPIWAVGLLGVAIAIALAAVTTGAEVWDRYLWARTSTGADVGTAERDPVLAEAWRVTVGEAFWHTRPWVLGVLAAAVLVAVVTAVRAPDGLRTWTFAALGSLGWIAWCGLVWWPRTLHVAPTTLVQAWPFLVEWPTPTYPRSPLLEELGEPSWSLSLPVLVEVLVVPLILVCGAWLGAHLRTVAPSRATGERPSPLSVTIAAVVLGGAATLSAAGGVVALVAASSSWGIELTADILSTMPEIALLTALVLAAALLSGSGPLRARSGWLPALALLAAWSVWFGPEIAQWYDGGADGLLVHAVSVLVVTALVWAWRPLATALDGLVAPPA